MDYDTLKPVRGRENGTNTVACGRHEESKLKVIGVISITPAMRVVPTRNLIQPDRSLSIPKSPSEVKNRFHVPLDSYKTSRVGRAVPSATDSITSGGSDSDRGTHLPGATRIARRVRPYGSGSAGVTMMQTTDLRDCDHSTAGRRLDFATYRRVAIQLAVRPDVVVVGDVPAKDPLEVRLAQHDHVIQTLSSNRTDHSFDVRILPRRSRRDQDLPDAHVVDPLPKVVARVVQKSDRPVTRASAARLP